MENDSVAEILKEIGVYLELKGENPFKTRAYVNAARAIEEVVEPLEFLVRDDRLGEIKGLGKALQEKVTTLVTEGSLPYYEELKASLPAGLIDMLTIPGMGPKKVKAVHDELGLDSIEALEAACRDGSLEKLSGFGAKTAERLLEGIAFHRTFGDRHRLDVVFHLATEILEGLRQHPNVLRCEIAGSLRRWKETVGDLDFVVAARHGAPVLEWFVQQPIVMGVIAKGDTKASVNLEGGIQADLRVVSDAEFPFTLAYFTGSKEHNIVMRQRAIARGLRLNEYGLFRSPEETRDPELRVACKTEFDLYQELGLQYIPPELREDRGEFDAAEQIAIPQLVEWTNMKGSLHNHSDWSDGRQTLEEVAAAACGFGFSYWAITDHSKSSFVANGLDEKRLLKQFVAIEEVNQRYEEAGTRFRLLTGSEVDILSGGRLDFPDEFLQQLEIVVASIHQGFSGSEEEMTKRLIRAAENRYVHILGHITGRLLLERDSYKINQRAVIDACAETGTWIELNASPYRMDMDWRLWHYAKDKGVKCVINTDAHRFEHCSYLRLGVGVARKGWLTRHDVINTRTLRQLRKALDWKRSKM